MNMEIEDAGSILLSNVYSPVVIADDTHKYIIIQRDGGLEIMCERKIIAVFRHGTCTIPEGLLEKEAQLAKGRVRYETCRYLDTRGPEGFCQIYKNFSHEYIYERCDVCTSFEGMDQSWIDEYYRPEGLVEKEDATPVGVSTSSKYL